VCITAELQPTSTTLCNPWIVERCDLVFVLKTHKTIIFHEFAPNLVNVHFPTQDQSFGTIYRCTFVPNKTSRVSRRAWQCVDPSVKLMSAWSTWFNQFCGIASNYTLMNIRPSQLVIWQCIILITIQLWLVFIVSMKEWPGWVSLGSSKLFISQTVTPTKERRRLPIRRLTGPGVNAADVTGRTSVYHWQVRWSRQTRYHQTKLPLTVKLNIHIYYQH